MIFDSGEIVGDYEIVGVVGIGGMGRVYRVRNLLSNRMEAMKVVYSPGADQSDLTERFLREIRLHATLEHPNIASLRTALRVNGQVVMIMELVEGASLAALLRRGPIDLPVALEYAGQVLSALEYAHAQGVVHRDVKPANVLIARDGTVKVTDFGIARARGDRQLTGAGMAPGSLSYMAPEQISGGVPDARADLYSFGVTLYETVTAVQPFRGANEYAIMQAHMTETPKPPSELCASVPPYVEAAILRAMAKNVEDRFQSAAEFRDALRPFGPAPAAPRPTREAFAFDPEELSRVETALAQALGPIARHLVSEASRAALSVEDLYARLAAQLADPGDRERFVRSCVRPSQSSSGARPALGPELLEDARRRLAVFVGPLAKILVNRAARNAHTPRELYSMLAAEIPSEGDRARFLASVPE